MRTARKLLHPRQLIRLTPLSIQFPDFPKNHDVTSRSNHDVTSSTILAAYATTIPDKDHGASELTPKEDPKILGWVQTVRKRMLQDKKPKVNTVSDLAPGQEALESRIIGPD